MLHWIAWALARLLYRVRVVGHKHLPPTGGILLVSNHVSYVDWLIIMAASRRKVRFIIASSFLNNPFYGWILRLGRVIPLDRRVGPKSLTRSLEAISLALRNGEVVCIFPEGYPTRNGVMHPFRRGFEQIAQTTPVPVIPVYVDQLWGSIFSYYGGRLFWKWPRCPQVSRVGCLWQTTVQHHHRPRHATATPRDVGRPGQGPDGRDPAGPPPVCPLGRPPSVSPMPDRYHWSQTANAESRQGSCCIDEPVALAAADGPRRPDGRRLVAAKRGGVLANLSLSMLHKAAVNLNYTSGEENVRSAIRQCGLRHVITSKCFIARVPLHVAEETRLVALEDALAGITTAQRVNAFIWTVLLPGWLLEPGPRAGNHKATDLATVIFSSGSTGEPKGVLLTHQNIAANVEAFVEFVNFTHRDRVLGMLPFFHVRLHGDVLGSSVSGGASSITTPTRGRRRKSANCVERTDAL